MTGVALALGFASAAQAGPPVGIGPHPWVIVLCNFSDEQVQPNTVGYFQQLFSDAGAGQLGELDYWRDVSFGQLSVAGTLVTGWVTARDPNNTANTLTRGEWINLNSPYSGGAGPRLDKILACADGTSGIDFSKYWGVAAIFPEARATLAAPIDATHTTLTLSTTQNFPDGSAPFLMGIDSGNASETVNVTGISGNTLTVVRGQGGTTAQAHGTGVPVGVPGDLGGVGTGQNTNPINGSNYMVATIILPHEIDVTGASHEMGHGFGYEQSSAGLHSRSISQSTSDYGDEYDLMSAYWCPGAMFSAHPGAPNYDAFGGGDFGGSGLYDHVLCGSDQNVKGPGLNAIDLDLQGWIPSTRHDLFSGGQSTITLHALSDPNALSAPSAQYLEARMPAAVTIQDQAPNGAPPTNPPTCSGTGYGCTTSLYYTVEYRQQMGWDRGFPASAVMLHLLGGDSLPYWVDQTPQGHNGLLLAGDEYVDAAHNTYVAVNAIDTTSRTARVTLGAQKLNAQFSYVGDTSGDYNDQTTLAGNLTVAGSGAPIPSASVTLALGAQSCPATTDLAGHASCQITITQDPGSYSAGGSFAGDSAYQPASGSAVFTINKEQSAVAYSGDLGSHYHDSFTATATLTDPDEGTPIAGKPITFTLGGSDTCTAATNNAGVATCAITPSQPAGTPNLVAGFAGDTDYLPSSASQAFTITPEETTISYTGPSVILGGSAGATLTATLVEDGSGDTDHDGGAPGPIPSELVTLTLGSQHCTGMTQPDGTVSCLIPSVTVPLGPETAGASFAGDRYYQAASASTTVIVFAFPSRGAFVLGDLTAAAAGPSTNLTWWSNSWFADNSLSGGTAPAAFKGFAGTVTLPVGTPPGSCSGTWASSGGNSPKPPTTVPSYMGVLVTDTISKAPGKDVHGDYVKIVVIRTDTGYTPNPGGTGSGTFVATYCP